MDPTSGGDLFLVHTRVPEIRVDRSYQGSSDRRDHSGERIRGFVEVEGWVEVVVRMESLLFTKIYSLGS